MYYDSLSCGLRLVSFSHVKHVLFYSWSTLDFEFKKLWLFGVMLEI
jgi:hypothetical protein